ncbi:PIN domain-containing protein [Mucilaginibacter sp. RCC_168]|uniref:PIN domain-containing protein n=1 Tax=Mucilaginibacter sp. RCC_168 TaxID=3239221 RepID=UPI00352425C2
MHSIFIDTNILLHFKTFDELPWSNFVNSEFKLIFPPIILDELDKHKNNSNAKIGKRSRMIAGKLIASMKGEQGQIVLEILKDRPRNLTFKKFNLDPKHQDDCLLASILEYKSKNNGEEVLLMTDDLMALARSETFGIQTIQLGEDLRLVESLDEQAKMIERLKKENVQLKERTPNVDLYFVGKLKVLKVEVKTNLKSREDIRVIEMAKIKQATPLMIIKEEKKGKTPLEIFARFNSNLLSNERKAAYNSKVEEYYRDYERYLAVYYDYAIKKFLSTELKFMIINEGNIPAQDIDIWIHLPDGFVASEKRMKEPREPEPPYKPKHDFDIESNGFSAGDLAARLNFNPSMPKINFDAPTIKKTNSYEVTYYCKSLKHDMENSFDKIFLQYDSFDSIKNFTIDYKLNIANVPAPVKGQLHVVFEKNSGKS